MVEEKIECPLIYKGNCFGKKEKKCERKDYSECRTYKDIHIRAMKSRYYCPETEEIEFID